MSNGALYSIYLLLTAYGFAVIWALLSWIACAGLSAYVAQTKGYSAIWWFIWGLAFGPLGLIAAAGLGARLQAVQMVRSPGPGASHDAALLITSRQEPTVGGSRQTGR